jgi:hypothetical protein
MSDRSLPELTHTCGWIARTYAIGMDAFDSPGVGVEAIDNLPKEWDYIIDDNEIFSAVDGVEPALHAPLAVALIRYYELTATALTATAGRGTLSPSMRLPTGVAYRPHTQVTFSPPAENLAFATRYAHNGPKIAILLGSSTGSFKCPDIPSWIRIIEAMARAFPTARFYLTGVRQSAGGKTHTAGYSDAGIQQILTSGPDIVDCYDIGPWNQMALVQGCDVLLSPSAGFAYLAPCVGTRPLVILGGDEVEYFFNDVPFYFVLPDNPDYPYSLASFVVTEEARIPCMRPENLDRKIPEMVDGLRLLLDPSFTFAAAVDRYQDNIARANVRRSSLVLPSDPALADF